MENHIFQTVLSWISQCHRGNQNSTLGYTFKDLLKKKLKVLNIKKIKMKQEIVDIKAWSS